MRRRGGTRRGLALVAPGALDTRTGGYGYDRRIVDGLRARGWTLTVHQLEGSFPRPSHAARERAARTLAAIPDGTIVLADGLALGAMPDEAAHEAGRLRLIALVHHPLAAETGLGPDERASLEASETRALSVVAHVVVTSRATADALATYHVPGGRISVVEPGTDPAPLSRGSGGGPPHLVCVAAVIPRKGHDVLLDGLERLGACGWRATCVGALDRDEAFVSRLRDRLRSPALAGRVTLAGEADEAAVAAYYDAADLFVLPTRYEGYGMAVAEALARGLPVVSTRTGAIADLVGDRAGIVVDPGDSEAFGRALAAVVCDPARRASLAGGARLARERLATWDAAVERMAAVLEG